MWTTELDGRVQSWMLLVINPHAAGVSGRTRRAGGGGWGKYYHPPGYLRNEAPKRNGTGGDRKALNMNFLMHA